MNEDKDFFEKSLNAFRQFLPDLANIFENYSPESTLFQHEDGGPDIRFHEVMLYGEDAQAYSDRQVEKFLKAPYRLTLSPPDTSVLDEFAGDFAVRMMKRATSAGMEFSTNPSEKKSHQLVVYGIGLGMHLTELVEKTQCRSLFLIEPNYEFLYHSMHVLDWSEFINSLKEHEAAVNILVSNSPREISDSVRHNLRAQNPSALDGSYIYTHYENSVFKEAQRIFAVESELTLSGLGFFRDEMGMLTNTFQNLSDGKSRIHSKIVIGSGGAKNRQGLPAMIIGSGPSLDSDLEFIKANRDRAVIFSSGTALRPLLTAGIKPDIQVELERGTPPLELLTKLSEEFDLSGIFLMASTTIDPRTRELFDDSFFFFRAALSPYPIFGDRKSALDIPGPTVANTSLSLAQELGFHNFYSFGVDFGARDPDRHHSVASDYFGEMEAEEEKDYGKPMPANFGGMVFTGFILQWAKDSFENAIERHPANTYYNCSDAVRIERMVPMLSETIELPEAVIKAQVIESIKNSAPIFDQNRFREQWRRADIFTELKHFSDLLCDIVEDDNFEDYFIITKKMADNLIYQSEEETPSTAMIYRGTIFMIMIVIYFYSNRLTERERLPEFRQIIAEEFITEMKNLENIATETIQDLDDTLPESDDAEGTVISIG